MTVKTVAREDVVTATPETPVSAVAESLRAEAVGCVVVVDETEPVGVVTDRDVAVRVVAEGADPDALPAAEVMTEDPVTVEADTGLFDLMETMGEAAVRRVPVVEDGYLAGIVTLDDMVVLLADELRNLAAVAEAESPPY